MPSSDLPPAKTGTSSDTGTPTDAGAPSPTIEFYWRPGCPFCMTLERALEGANVPLDRRNIWDDPEAAAFVRSVANGNETVPTVRVGSISLVNPSAATVAAVIVDELPALATSMSELPQPKGIGKLLQRLING